MSLISDVEISKIINIFSATLWSCDMGLTFNEGYKSCGTHCSLGMTDNVSVIWGCYAILPDSAELFVKREVLLVAKPQSFFFLV